MIPDKAVQIDQIMDNFDFLKVIERMEVLDWRWYDKGEFSVPTIEELTTQALGLLNHVEKDGSERSGGLHAFNLGGYLGLSFSLATYFYQSDLNIVQT